jgi:hypothetical protein
MPILRNTQMSTPINLNDIKFDLLKIIEPYDGFLETTKPNAVRRLFVAYLCDLQTAKSIFDFSIDIDASQNVTTFNVSIRLMNGRAPKKLKIHVGNFAGSGWAVPSKRYVAA